MSTAALVIIGDEILSGKYQDENSPFAISFLREIGCDLKQIVVISDLLEEIAHTVRALSQKFDHVITSGGVGPTHDDITFEGIAQGFDVPLVQNDDLIKLLLSYKMELSPANLQMVTMPKGTELVGDDVGFPAAHFRNIWILPGVPRLFQRKLRSVSQHLSGAVVVMKKVRLERAENELAATLREIAESHTEVSIGSYPRFEGAHYVVVTVESRDSEAVEVVIRRLLREFDDCTEL